jgi:hypothetical protein
MGVSTRSDTAAARQVVLGIIRSLSKRREAPLSSCLSYGALVRRLTPHLYKDDLALLIVPRKKVLRHLPCSVINLLEHHAAWYHLGMLLSLLMMLFRRNHRSLPTSVCFFPCHPNC